MMYEVILLHMRECVCVYVCSVWMKVNISSFHYHLELLQAWRRKKNSFKNLFLRAEI